MSYEIALRWMPYNPTFNKSWLVLLMAWCLEATSRYLQANVDLGLCRPMALPGHSELMIQWNLYKATFELHGLSRQVIFHDRKNMILLKLFQVNKLF